MPVYLNVSCTDREDRVYVVDIGAVVRPIPACAGDERLHKMRASVIANTTTTWSEHTCTRMSARVT